MPRTGAPVITLESLQIGSVITEGDPADRDVLRRQWTTAFYKREVAGGVSLTEFGLAGDAVADRQNHGGKEKAILCYAASHYPLWRDEHPELSGLSAGGFAENLTLAGATEHDVCLGDQFLVNDAHIEISQPRQPCWKISRRWGIKTLTKEVAQTGRTGWYARVLNRGTIQAADRLELVKRPHPEWTVARANDVLFGREVDRASVIELMNVPELSSQWKEAIA